jgi:hypothetical protein
VYQSGDKSVLTSDVGETGTTASMAQAIVSRLE